MLRVSRIGHMKIDLHRELEGKIKTMTIKREGKHYYAIFTTATETSPPKVEDTNIVGIDMGLYNFIALSDGTTVQKPKFFKRRAKRIAKWQRTIARRRKGSKRRQAARYKLQREWARVTGQSNDFMHKLSNGLVRGSYTSFAVEARTSRTWRGTTGSRSRYRTLHGTVSCGCFHTRPKTPAWK